MSEDPGHSPDSYALGLANDSYEWYRQAAIRSRRAFKIIETLILVVSAAIPVSAALAPSTTTVPAVLGAAVVVLGGLRGLFHWHDNYLRFSGAREAVEAERRLYHTMSPPYEDPASRDQILAVRVTQIEREEMAGWVKIASVRPKP
jgi:hypothetical protein